MCSTMMAAMKAMLHRIVAMLTRTAMEFDGVSEPVAAFDAEIDYDNEHRYTEHEHESRIEETPEPWDRDRGPVTRDPSHNT